MYVTLFESISRFLVAFCVCEIINTTIFLISKQNHHSASCHNQDIPYYHFDYHAEVKGSNLKNLDKLKARIMKHLHQFGFFCIIDENITHQQTGTIRTNCLDCLDRTNATQTMIGLEVCFHCFVFC